MNADDNMPELTKAFIDSALRNASLWSLGNSALYKLCSENPDHTRIDVIIAKFWLIGRSYSAAVERRRNNSGASADKFYENLAKRVRAKNIDKWLAELGENNDSRKRSKLALKIHYRLTNLLKGPTGQTKRSFASKYLHFHFREIFHLYDSRAEWGVSNLTAGHYGRGHFKQHSRGVDTKYAEFCARCQAINDQVEKIYGHRLSTRDLDHVLLAWHKKYKKKPKPRVKPS